MGHSALFRHECAAPHHLGKQAKPLAGHL